MLAFPMKFSTLPFLLLIELFSFWFATRRAVQRGHIDESGATLITILLVLLVVWAGVSSWMAISGVFQSEPFLSSWPAFWVAFVAVAIVMTPLMVSCEARETVRSVIDTTPMHWMVGFQAMRSLAIGGVMKALNGEFSRYFGLYIGIPDMIFGLSALLVAWMVYRKRVGTGTLIIWNLFGAMIIVPFGLVLLQMGLPGPWMHFDETPGISTIFEFPMALAPTVVVPLFVMVNLFVAIRLIERSMAGDKTLESKTVL